MSPLQKAKAREENIFPGKPLPVAAPRGAQSPPPQQGKKPSVLPAACPGACTLGTASPLPLGTGHWQPEVIHAQHPRQELYLGQAWHSLAAAMNCKTKHSRHTEPLHLKGSAPCQQGAGVQGLPRQFPMGIPRERRCCPAPPPAPSAHNRVIVPDPNEPGLGRGQEINFTCAKTEMSQDFSRWRTERMRALGPALLQQSPTRAFKYDEVGYSKGL